ncbi:PREDICTED: general transcription factor IIH subunit 3-like isoform X2 [Priapulus caudatus]|nr:PREDICTED: general transcription factor IIH subunit 3-like isoform X2 [Priapulus caudatus]
MQTESGVDENQLHKCLDSIMVFCNSHLMLNSENKLAVLASHTDQSKFLYPKAESATAAAPPSVEPREDVISMATGEESNDSMFSRTNGPGSCGEGKQTSSDGRHELLAQLDDSLIDQLKEMILNDSSQDNILRAETMLAGALALALCYIHRMMKEHTKQGLKSRILVIKAGEDSASQYLPFMNAVFTAQKLNVPIDACLLGKDSGLLQQGSDITGGIYLQIPNPMGLLQYLLWVFLPDADTREKLVLPPRVQVDYRAACFCHRNLIDIGYVCSVCLSIFCHFSPICSTCQTTFKIMGRPGKAKKRKLLPK